MQLFLHDRHNLFSQNQKEFFLKKGMPITQKLDIIGMHVGTWGSG